MTYSFGKTTAGSSSSASSTTKIAASQATPTASGTITAGHAHVWLSASGSCSVAMVLYADSSGAPGALLAQSDTVTLTQTTDVLVDFTFSGANQVAITSGTPYWIGVEWSDPGSPSVNIGRDSTTNGRLEVQGFTFGSPPNPFGTGNPLSGPIAAYIDFVKTGTAAGSLGALTGTATGVATRHGTAAGTLGPLIGFAAPTIFGTAAGTLGPLIGSAVGAPPPFDDIPASGPAYPADDLYPSDELFPYQPPARPPNPNWPIVGVEVDFTQGPPWTPSDKRQSVNSGYRQLHVRGLAIQRGRQYELDQTQAGTLSLDLPDPQELLNPDNTTSPYNNAALGYEVTPYRCVQVWAMWPSQPGAGNIINSAVDETCDPTFEAGTGGWTIPPGNGLGGNIGQTTATAFLGSTALQVQQDSNGHEMGVSRGFCTAPGVTYTFSAYVYPLGGTDVWVRVQDASGGVFLSQPATVDSQWQRISVTWTAVDTLETVTIFGVQPASASNPNFFVDATMLNFGDILEPFQVGGPIRYRLYTGYVERWPTTYDMQGLRALRPLEAVDALAILSRTEIHQSYEAEVTVDRPGLYFPLNNAVPPAGAANLGSGFGAGGRVYNVLSQNGQINWGGDQNLDGTPAVSFTAQNPNDPPVANGSNSYTEMAVLGGAVSLDTVNGFTMEVWAKWSGGTAQVGTLELLQVGDQRGLNFSVPVVGWCSFGFDTLEFFYNTVGTAGNGFGVPGSGAPLDGEWHHLAITFAGTRLDCYLDGQHVTYRDNMTPVGHLGLNTFYMQATTSFGIAQAQMASSRFAVYPGLVSPGRIKAHWDRGSGYSGELPGARVTRLLDALWGGPVSVAAGNIQLAADFSYDTRTLLDVLQEIQETERGLVYVDRFGTVTFEDRHTRYQTQQALWTFGEGVNPFVPLNLNADFSAGMGGWTVVGAAADVSQLAWHSAPQSVAFWPDGVTAYPHLESGKVPVTPGLSYSASCWALCPAGLPGGASASINWYDASGLFLSTASYFTSLPVDEWVQLDLTAHAPAGAAFATVAPTLLAIPASTVLVYLDEAQIFPTGQAIEYPYKEYATDHDPTYVFTEFDLTRPDNQNYPPIVNGDAELRYGQRIASQEVQCIRDFDLDQAGIFYTQRYAEPKTRISKLVLDPAANPALWDTVLSLEISQRIRVIRRSPAFTYSAEYYIEQINHKVTAANGEWTVELQCSPVFVPQAWVLNDTAFGVLGTSTTPVY